MVGVDAQYRVLFGDYLHALAQFIRRSIVNQYLVPIRHHIDVGPSEQPCHVCGEPTLLVAHKGESVVPIHTTCAGQL